MTGTGRRRERGAGRVFWTTFSVLLLLLGCAAGFLGWYVSRGSGETGLLLPAAAVDADAELAGTRSVLIYHLRADGRALLAEERPIPTRDRLDEDLRAVLDALLAADLPNGAVRVFPSGTRLQSVFHDVDQGRIVLDFNSRLVSGHPGGVAAEQATLRVLLRTIAVNFPEIRSVGLLVDGRQTETLAGHVRCDRPLVPARWE
ncbi:MAG TPA: GerMN domain-containing protein [Candidatus Krumholzibacteria bacterium]|nr:GerMN domain-containing protein [Candidatus Krumholzibacteria bacterium]HRX51148.1 GerMN domain-containing protein [Candidatus Krumholzibacteria bacterium]